MYHVKQHYLLTNDGSIKLKKIEKDEEEEDKFLIT
jgi:hypothetical protein